LQVTTLGIVREGRRQELRPAADAESRAGAKERGIEVIALEVAGKQPPRRTCQGPRLRDHPRTMHKRLRAQ